MKKNLSDPNPLFEKISILIDNARQRVATVANLTMVHTYFEVGRMIVEDEQEGQEKAAYGKYILKNLSIQLVEKYGSGFSERNLRNMRQFFLMYSERSHKEILSELPKQEQQLDSIWQTASAKLNTFTLSWSHYLILMRIENPDERRFYEIEATQQNWSERQLKRQYHASLYERLALSRNKEEVILLAQKGQQLAKPTDILKNPLTLEFLGMEEKTAYSESDLEQAIISKIQDFLLELGKGFLFEARQKRFTFNEKHFKVDLVFYNRLLQCYVLIDLKTDELAHQDLGQMQMYVNYYDRHVKLPFEKPTIGMLLCKEKDDAIVELTLPANANIYAAEYSLYLPDKQLLQQKLTEWLAEFDG